MGVDARFYTVYGVKVPYDKEFVDYFYDDPSGPDGHYPTNVDLIMDGMGGRYIIIGKILFAGEECDDPGLTIINISDLLQLPGIIQTEFRKNFPEEYWNLVENNAFFLMSFIHYS